MVGTTAAAVWVDVLPSMKGFGSALEKEGSSAAGATGKKMAAVLGGALAAGFAAIKLGGLIKEAANLDNQMREVVTLFGETGAAADASLGQVKAQVRSLSDEFGIAQETLTEGLYSAISAGVPRENALEFMQVASKAAIGGVTDVATAVDGLTTVINAFGMDTSDAQKVADSMFTAVKGGKTTFEELSASYFQVAPSASAAGIAFEEVNAALATITSAGTPTAVATTRIRAAIDELAKPGTKVSKVFQQIAGKDFRTFIAEGGNLESALQLLQGEAEKTGAKIGDYFGSVEAGGAATTLAVTGAEKFRTEIEAQAKSAGAAQAAFDVVNEGAQRQFEIATTRLKNIGISVGAALLPVLVRLARAFADDILPAVMRLKAGFERDFLPPLMSVWSMLTTQVIPAVASFGGWIGRNRDFLIPFAAAVATIVAGFKIYAAVQKTVTAVTLAWNLVLAMNPIGLVVIAIAALVAALVMAYKRSETFRNLVDSAFRAVAAAASFMWDNVLKPAFTAMQTVLGVLWNYWYKPIFGLIVSVFQNAWERAQVLGKVIGAVFTVLQAVLSAYWNYYAKPILEGLMWLFRQAWEKAQEFGRFVGEALAPVREAFKVVKDKVTDFWDALKKIEVPKPIKEIADLVGKIAGGIGGAAGGVAKFFGVGDGPGRPVGSPAGGNTLARVKPLLDRMGGYVTSTYRSPAHNARIGGSPTSYHMDRNNPAVDIGGPTAVLDRIAAALRAMGGWRELLWRVKGHFDHVHVAHRGGMVSPSWPSIAGLRPDERPAILQTGERVVSRAEVRAEDMPRGQGGFFNYGTIITQDVDELVRLQQTAQRDALAVAGVA
jgi:TP901 family phage tail tape measure protein